MEEPGGELVELDFYFRQWKRADAFARVVRYCLGHGGKFAGTIWCCRESEARDHHFISIYERPLCKLVITQDELEDRLEDRDTDVIKVAI